MATAQIVAAHRQVSPAPAPVKVAARTATIVPAPAPAPRAVALPRVAVIARAPAQRISRLPGPWQTYRRVGRIMVAGRPEEPIRGLGAVVEPTPARMGMMLDYGTAILDDAIDAGRAFMGWALGAAEYAYSRGASPAAIWGANASAVARDVYAYAGIVALRRALQTGAWVFVVVGDKLGIASREALGEPMPPIVHVDLGVVPWPVSSDPSERFWHQLAIAFGMTPLGVTVSGPVAAGEALVSGGAAASTAQAEISATTPVAIRAAGAGASPSAAASAARSAMGKLLEVINGRAAITTIKYAALAAGAVGVASYLPDIGESLRSGKTRVGEAGASAAAGVVQRGLETNDPEMVGAGLRAMREFQAGAEEDKWLYAVGGAAVGMFIAKR
jgi:hypothetical protein